MSLLADLSRELATLAATAARGVVGLEHARGQGSGVVLSADGYVLTNAHVARSTGPLRVRLPGAAVSRAELVGADDRTDLAVVRMPAGGPPPLELADSRRLQVGQLVMAIGNPLGFDRSVSLGVVSALFRELPTGQGGVLEGLIQTDAAVNPGHSGGPLLDMDGRVVGINTAMIAPGRGIGFAVPAHTASWVAAVLIQHGEVRRPYLGIFAHGEDLEPGLARETGQGRAIRVVRVEADTPAATGGLTGGDLLLAANATPVATLDDLARVLVLGRPDALDVDVLRSGARQRFVLHPRARAA
ncbi:MAG: peptidase S1 [Acidobacteria bacterium]|nr:MAG: peptidase S1 [Acidobacteriota bacterium]